MPYKILGIFIDSLFRRLIILSSRAEIQRQSTDPNHVFKYNSKIPGQDKNFKNVQYLSESLRNKRQARKKKNSELETVQDDEECKCRDVYRNQWSSLLRLIWTDSLILNLFEMNPTTTTISNLPEGFQFICRTLAEIVVKEIFFNVEKLKVTDEGINKSQTYFELPLVNKEGMILFNSLIIVY